MTAVPAFGPFAFELTPEEAGAAASRLALRAALEDGLLARHLAPLAAFVLAMLFAAILAFTGLVSRREAEIVLLCAAGAFMLQRFWSRRRFGSARRSAARWVEALRSAGQMIVSVDEGGLRLAAGPLQSAWSFAEARDVEDAGGMVYVWPARGEPAVLPARVFPDQTEVTRFVAFAKARRATPSAVEEDD